MNRSHGLVHLCRTARSVALLLIAGGIGMAAYAQPGASQPAAAPAPVPAAVAMPRPTSAEVEAARRAFERFRETADAATIALLDKYPGLLEVRPPQPNTAVIPSLSPMFQAKHRANLEVARQGDAEVLFMGDSITDFWRNADGPFAGKPVFDKYFGHWKVANFGIAGDTTQGVLYRLQNGEGRGFSPKAVMLMIGTNNTFRNSAAEIAEGIGAVVLQLRNDFPQAKILLLGVFPRSRANDPVRATIAQINSTIAKLHDGNHVHYLDIGNAFLDAQGDIPADIMSDALHPSPRGYEIWAKAVIEPLSKLMGTAVAPAVGAANYSGSNERQPTDDVMTGRRRFEPAAHTAWHIHPGGQLLFVEDGVGVVQRRGEALKVLRKGESDFTLAGVEHWHGAAPDQHAVVAMAHFGGIGPWLEPVSDADYAAATQHMSAPARPQESRPAANARAARSDNEDYVGDSSRVPSDDMQIARGRFEAGAHTHWHIHSKGQLILAEQGSLFVQRRGEPVKVLRAGESDFTPAGVAHWHGAAPAAPAVKVVVGFGAPTLWLDAVTDAEHAAMTEAFD